MLQFDSNVYTHDQIQHTKDLLSSIAQHLSSKESCRHYMYRVIVTDTTVTFHINARLCRTKGDVKSAESVIWHIIGQHFQHIFFKSLADYDCVEIIRNSLVPGVYVYMSSVGNKQRRWFKDVDY